jgi:hypothetical protein
MFHSSCPGSQYKIPSGPLPPHRRTWRDDHFNAIGEWLAGFLGLGMLRPVLPRVRYGGALCSTELFQSDGVDFNGPRTYFQGCDQKENEMVNRCGFLLEIFSGASSYVRVSFRCFKGLFV